MRFPRNAKIFRGQLDVAPFAGVFFLLVILVSLHSQLVFPPGVEIELPTASGFIGVPNPRVVVAIDAHGNLYYQNQAVEPPALMEELKGAVKRSSDALTLVILADRRVPHEEIVDLSVRAREAGLERVILGTRSKKGQARSERP